MAKLPKANLGAGYEALGIELDVTEPSSLGAGYEALGVQPNALGPSAPDVPTETLGGQERLSGYSALGIDLEDLPEYQPYEPPLETPGFLETMGTLISGPTSTDAFPEAIGTFTDAVVPDSMQRGFYRAQQGSTIGNMDTSDPYKVADSLIDSSAQLAEYPMDADTAEALNAITDPNASWGDMFRTALTTKGGLKAVLAVTGESLVQYAPALATGAAATAITKNPNAGAAAMFPVTFGVTFNTILMEEMRKNGADPDDPANRDKIASLLQDENFWSDARVSAGAYSLPIAAFDALSFGLAGKLIAPAIAARSKLAVPAAAVGEVALQGVVGAAGEAAGELAQMGVGARDELSRGDIFLEGIAEGPIGAIETAIQTPANLSRQKAATEQRNLENALATEDVARAFDPTPGQGYNLNLDTGRPVSGYEALGIDIPSEAVTSTQTPVQTVSLEGQQAIAEPEVPATETPVLPDPVETPQNETPPAGRTLVETPNPRITNTAAVSNRREITSVDQSEAVTARPVIVELDDLKQATGALQPRDRSLAESDSGVRKRAVELDPRQLGDSPIGDSGAPIILSDGTIVSGNGRALTLREVYNDQDLVQQRISYKSFLRDYLDSNKGQAAPVTDRQAGKLNADVASMRQPVLVMQIEGDITTDAAVRFAQGNNLDRTARMGATEQAQLDADRLTDSMLRVYMGGNIESRDNKMFLDAFSRDIVAENERGSFSRDGRLTKEGAQRIEAAILAKTYKDTGVLANMLESRDDNIRNITSAMLGASPAFARLQAEIAAGRIDAEYDITPAIVEVAKTISQLRNEGVKVKDFLAQQDAFTDLDPLVEALIVAFYDGNRALSAKKLTQVLGFYVDEASQKEAGGFFEDDTTSQDIVQVAREKVDRGEGSEDSGQISFIEQGSQRDAAQPIQSREQAQRPTDEKRSADTRGRRSETEGRSQQKLDRKAAPASQLDKVIDQRTRKTGQVETVEQSIIADVFVAAGYNADTAMSLPPKRQIKIISDTFEQRFGIKVIVKDNANVKSAINKLMAGYVAFENMAHSLQMPPSVLGLNGTLRFYLDGGLPGQGALAYYSNADKEIHQVVESNVFAHEWFHALDYWIQDSYGTRDIAIDSEESAESNRGQSARVRKARKEQKAFAEAAPSEVTEAFERLIRTLYTDAAAEAGKIMQLEKEIARLEARQRQTGKQYKSLEVAQGRLNNILAGRSSARVAASSMNEQTKGDNYLNRPTEMFARGGEAFVARQLDALKADSDLVSPGDNFYDVMAEDFIGENPFELTRMYPQAEDRLKVFGAYADLMQALYETGEFGQRNALDTGVGRTKLDPMGAWKTTPPRYQGSPMKKIFDEMDRETTAVKNAQIIQERKQPKIKHNKPLGMKVWESYDRFAGGIGIATKDGHILSISGRYADNKLMQDIRKKVTYNPGGMDGTVAGGTVYDKTQQRMNEYTAKLGQIVTQYDLDNLPVPVTDILRDFLTGQEDTIDLAIKHEGADYDLSVPARELRQLMDQIYTYLNKAGVNVNYLREGGYLPRMIDDTAIFENQKEFIQDASRVYEIIFTNEVGEFNASAEQLEAIIERLDRSITANLTSEMATKLADARSMVQNESAEVTLEESELQEIYEAVKKAEAEVKARNWNLAIGMAQSGDIQTGSTAANFTKKRSLPTEADRILQRYYIDNPIIAIQNYIMGATRKAEYNRAFGLQNIPKGQGKLQYNDYLDWAREQLVEQGVHRHDIHEFIETIKRAAGVNMATHSRTSWQNRMSDRVAAGVTVPLLGAATISSIAEPFTTALQTGDVRDGVKSFYFTLRQAWQSSSWMGDTDKFETLDQVARIIGASQDMQFGDVIKNRLGGGYLSDSKVNGFVTRFFIANMLGPVTNAQRRAQVQIFSKMFYEIAKDFNKYEGDKSESARTKLNRHKRMLQDFGVSEDALPQFVEYVINMNQENGELKYRQPTVSDLTNERGAIEGIASVYVNALSRASRMAVQDPQPGVKPLYAEHPLPRIIFAITSFIFAFQRNVIIKVAKGIIRDAKDNGKLRATQYAALRVALPAAMLYAGHLAVATLREAAFNKDRWEEKEREDELAQYLLMLGLSRAGFYGAFDPVVNGIYGIKYQRDLSNSVVGSISYYTTALAKMANTTFNDNENSLYDEYQGWQGFYEAIAVPAMSFGFAAVPENVVPRIAKQTMLYPGLLNLRSADAKKEFANQMVELFNGRRYVPRNEKQKRR